LTAAEEKLFKYLIESGKAEIYWDADDYYLLDPRQEAGRFLREYVQKNTFGPLNWIGNTLSEDKKTINVIGVPGNVGQAKLAGGLLSQAIKDKGTPDGVALVLVDEGLLLPVLNSIPAETGDFNVTMGFPLKHTPVFSLLNIVISMFANAKHYAQPAPDSISGDDPVQRFYYKDIQRFLSHPFIITSEVNTGQISGKPEKTIISRSFYNPGELQLIIQSYSKALSDVFKPYLEKTHIEPGDAIKLLLDIISFLRNAFSPDKKNENGSNFPSQSLEAEYLYHAAQLCSKLETITNDPALKPDIETVQSLVNTLIAGMRLPFYGEPLNGLQVMGMLETRLLDFTDIIMVSVNEGLLPRGKHQSTFIPDEVRTHFGMQRYTERTAVFAYHFYRLMQRVENAWLIYNTEGDELGGGEKSRFISQMIYELPQINKNLSLTEQTLSVAPVDTKPVEISIEKTPQVKARLHQLANRGLSPTALAMYMKCKLQFYFAQVLRISEPEQVDETIDAATLGEIVHEALHKTYEARKNTLISSDVIKAMLPEAIAQVRTAFAIKFSKQELTTGKNLLIVKVAENMIKRFLLAEMKFLEQSGGKIEIIMLEENLESDIQITDPAHGEIYNVKIHGKADRIDRVGGLTRIIDYKTGKVEANDLKTDQITNFREKNDSGKLLQVLTYALMYTDMNPNEHVELNSGIISLRKTSAYYIKTAINKTELLDKELLNAFRKELEVIIASIYDSSEQFSQTENLETCNLCAFSTICNRAVN